MPLTNIVGEDDIVENDVVRSGGCNCASCVSRHVAIKGAVGGADIGWNRAAPGLLVYLQSASCIRCVVGNEAVPHENGALEGLQSPCSIHSTASEPQLVSDLFSSDCRVACAAHGAFAEMEKAQISISYPLL